MEDIRDEDRGKETMVFEITSISLNAVLQFCVGNPYEHKGKDRYNVYLVKNGKVNGCIGHYDVEQGEVTTDAGGKDFDVKKYEEPDWLIEASSSLLTREVTKEKDKAEKDKAEKDKVEKEKDKAEKEKDKVDKPEKDKVDKPEKAKPATLFRVVITSTAGDCFYDSVVRSEKDAGYNEDAIIAFKEKLGAFITKEGPNKINLIEKYKAFVDVKGTKGKTQTLIEDAYYRKYCEMRNDGIPDADILVQMRKDLDAPDADPNLAKNVNPEDFELLQNDDESPNKPAYTRDISALSDEYIRDFFGNKKNLEDDDIIDTFLENFMKKTTWADSFIIAQTAVFMNVIFLLMVEKGKRVEDYTVFNMQSQLEHPIDKDTQFIIADYQPQSHFKLIAQREPFIGRFTIDTLPQVIKDKFKLFQSKGDVLPATEEETATYEPVAVDVAKAPEVPDAPEAEQPDKAPEVKTGKYTAELLKKKSIKDLLDILKTEFPDVPQSRVQKDGGKQGLIDCILNPEDEKCKKASKSKKPAGGKFTRRR
jgi:hypothetical protein